MAGDPNYKEVTVPIQDVEQTIEDNAPDWTLEKKMDVADTIGPPAKITLGFRRYPK